MFQRFGLYRTAAWLCTLTVSWVWSIVFRQYSYNVVDGITNRHQLPTMFPHPNFLYRDPTLHMLWAAHGNRPASRPGHETRCLETLWYQFFAHISPLLYRLTLSGKGKSLETRVRLRHLQIWLLRRFLNICTHNPIDIGLRMRSIIYTSDVAEGRDASHLLPLVPNYNPEMQDQNPNQDLVQIPIRITTESNNISTAWLLSDWRWSTLLRGKPRNQDTRAHCSTRLATL